MTEYAAQQCTNPISSRCTADALAVLASLLLSSDRAVLQLLHVLDWRPVLQQLSPVATHLQFAPSLTSTADQPSLLDDDATMHHQDSSGAAAAQPKQGDKGRGVERLDADVKSWATQLLLLLLPAYVVMAESDVPEWISRLVKGDEEAGTAAGMPK